MLPEYFLQKTWENAAVLFPNAVRISRMKGTAERQALPPAFMRGEGHEVAGGVPRGGGESLLSHGFAVPAPPEGNVINLRISPNENDKTEVDFTR